MLQVLVLLAFPLAMTAAASYDLLTMTIPNKLSVLLAAAFLICFPLSGLGLEAFIMHIASGLLVLMVGFTFFSLGWIGGGDAKFAAAAALWLGMQELMDFGLVAAAYGGLLTLAILSVRGFPLPAFALGWDWLTRLHDRRTGVPYGIALAAAGLMIYPSSPLWKVAF